jgi:hypothetical protein
VEDPFAPSRKAHPGILVHGLRPLAARLAEAGHPVTWDDHFPGHDRCYVDDPFGNRLELLEPRG